MPSATSPLTAVIGFTLPASRLDHDASVYMTYEPDRTRPTEHVRVPMTDLRPELDGDEASKVSPADQLAERGFAVLRHESGLLDGIPSEEGTQKYLDQCTE